MNTELLGRASGKAFILGIYILGGYLTLAFILNEADPFEWHEPLRALMLVPAALRMLKMLPDPRYTDAK